MKPLVSILIPAYNAEPWIADTIQSALRQTWPHKEIIVVDDGSKDKTFSVAQQFAGAEVTVITQKNAGASAARNKAFSLSKGDFIQWLDADDLLGAEKISRQMAVVEKTAEPRALFSSEWGRFMYRPQRAHFESTPLCADQPPVEWLVRKLGQNLHMRVDAGRRAVGHADFVGRRRRIFLPRAARQLRRAVCARRKILLSHVRLGQLEQRGPIR